MKSIAFFFETPKGQYIKNLIIGVAAAVIMIGALFKIEHIKGASTMLFIGLCTEAFIFLLLGILPPPKDYYWEKVYPGLDIHPHLDSYSKGGKSLVKGETPIEAMNRMMAESNMDANQLKKLGLSFDKIGTTVDQMKDLTDMASASNEFSSSAREAAGALGEMKNTFVGASNTMASFNDAAEDTTKFHQQVQVLSKNLGDLNRIYEVELTDANNHLKAMNQFYSNLVSASDSMAASASDAAKAKEQMAVLANNLSQLNQVYGNMLTAMSGR